MGAGGRGGSAVLPSLTADFSGRLFHLPPGIQRPPSYITETQKPCWVSSIAGARVIELGEPGHHVVMAGRTLWLDHKIRPASIVLSHPNRLGGSEDIVGLIDLASRWKSSVWVDVDPYLVGMVELPPPLRGLVRWDGAGSALDRAGTRCRLAADSFRRRVTQIPRVRLTVERQSGRSVSVITPVPGQVVVQRLKANGALVDSLPLWGGVVILWFGWWHTRRQIDQLASALTAAIEGESSSRIDDDNFDRLPEDLPRRRLDTI